MSNQKSHLLYICIRPAAVPRFPAGFAKPISFVWRHLKGCRFGRMSDIFSFFKFKNTFNKEYTFDRCSFKKKRRLRSNNELTNGREELVAKE